MPARGTSKVAAITALKEEFGGGSGGGDFGSGHECKKVAAANHPFGDEDLLRGEIEGIRMTAAEVLTFESGDGWNPCDHFSIPDDFTMKKCVTDYNQENEHDKPSVCYNDWPMHMLGIEIDPNGSGTDFKVSSNNNNGPQGDHFDHFLSQYFCPTTADSVEDIWESQGEQEWNQTVAQQKRQECRTEFLALAPAEQLEPFIKLQMEHLPGFVSVMCTGPSEVKTEIDAILTASCMPRVRLDHICDEEGNCNRSLRCEDSKEAGKCFNGQGAFIGRLPGRHEMGRFKTQVNGAFEITSQSQTVDFRWDEDNNKPKPCKRTHAMVSKGSKTKILQTPNSRLPSPSMTTMLAKTMAVEMTKMEMIKLAVTKTVETLKVVALMVKKVAVEIRKGLKFGK